MRDHSAGVVPATAWDQAIFIDGIPLRAMICSMELPLTAKGPSLETICKER